MMPTMILPTEPMTDERLAAIEAVYAWQIDCGDLDTDMVAECGELLHEVKALREVLQSIQELPRYSAIVVTGKGKTETLEVVRADELEQKLKGGVV